MSIINSNLKFSKKETLKIKKLKKSKPKFKKNINLVITAWRLQRISTKNAVDVIKKELKKY